ncbi:MAG: CDP-alcohol phosphatidyltransferase family protein [Kiloniellales bacterium]
MKSGSLETTQKPWDARLAAVLVRPLVDTPITPNHITSLSLLLALIAAGLFATGDPGISNWAAGLFILARFTDHMDGELARMAGKTSTFGHWYDYVVGGLSHAALFLALGVGMSEAMLGAWAVPAGGFVALFILLNMGLRMRMDRDYGSHTVSYPGTHGVDLEDTVYLLGPITWLGGLEYFFLLGCFGTLCFALWTIVTFIARRRGRPSAP